MRFLGAIAQFEKAATVAKLKAARERVRSKSGKCGGRTTYAERDPSLVAAVFKVVLSAFRVPDIQTPATSQVSPEEAHVLPHGRRIKGRRTPSGGHRRTAASCQTRTLGSPVSVAQPRCCDNLPSAYCWAISMN